MPRTRTRSIVIALGLLVASPAVADTTLVIESWRDFDLPVWQDQLIPAFEAAYPGIRVLFLPSPGGQYDEGLVERLAKGSAGDLISCRPFEPSRKLFEGGHLASLNELPEIARFSKFAKAAWSTGDGNTTYCVPVASVIHGFIYNADAFEKLGIAVPSTEADFLSALEKINEDGTYVPLAMGTQDGWEASVLGYQNIGPADWKGEQGRQALMEGTQKLTDPQWVEPFNRLARWKDYLDDGFETRSYTDSQQLFLSGKAAIYPAGSWEASGFTAQARFRLGAFAPPVKNPGGTCYITDQPDIGIGLNAASANRDAALAFLKWVASPEFAALYADALPGFVGLLPTQKLIENPLARSFAAWRSRCKSTLRPFDTVQTADAPNFRHETWLSSVNVINGTQTPVEAAEELQKHLSAAQSPAK